MRQVGLFHATLVTATMPFVTPMAAMPAIPTVSAVATVPGVPIVRVFNRRSGRHVLFRVFLELMLAGSRTEIVGLSLILGLLCSGARVHAHSADRIDSLCHDVTRAGCMDRTNPVVLVAMLVTAQHMAQAERDHAQTEQWYEPVYTIPSPPALRRGT
mgnify:CR=1 FL=1